MKAVTRVNTGERPNLDTLDVKLVPENDYEAMLLRSMDFCTPSWTIDANNQLTTSLRCNRG